MTMIPHALVPAAVAASTGLLLAAPWAGAANGGLTVRVLPATAGDLTAHSSLAFALPPGRSAEGRIVVGNTTTHLMHLAVSAVDGVTAQTSGAVFADRSAPRRRDARWLTPSQSSLLLGPGDEAPLAVAVHVPARARPGDHLAGLSVQDVAPASTGPGFGIRQILRSVVGVLVVVPGRARFVPRLAGVSLRRVRGAARAQVLVRLGNAGQRLAGPRLAVTLARGGHRRTVVRHLDTLLPGADIAFPLPWPQRVTRGPYRVTVALQRLRRHYPDVRLGA